MENRLGKLLASFWYFISGVVFILVFLDRVGFLVYGQFNRLNLNNLFFDWPAFVLLFTAPVLFLASFYAQKSLRVSSDYALVGIATGWVYMVSSICSSLFVLSFALFGDDVPIWAVIFNSNSSIHLASFILLVISSVVAFSQHAATKNINQIDEDSPDNGPSPSPGHE